MITGTFVTRAEAEKLCQEFTSDKFYSDRLGFEGIWVGKAAEQLCLPEIDTAKSLDPLLKGILPGQTKDGLTPEISVEVDRVFKLEITAPPVLNALFAAAGEDRQAMISGENYYAALIVVRGFLHDQEKTQSISHGKHDLAHPLGALFCSEISRDQRPLLQTTALFLCHGIKDDGSTREIDLANFSNRRLNYFYEAGLEMGLDSALDGPGHRVIGGLRIPAVPEKLVDHFARIDGHQQKSAWESVNRAKECRGEALLQQWRQEATALGWGPREVESMVRGAKVREMIRHVKDSLLLANPFRRPTPGELLEQHIEKLNATELKNSTPIEPGKKQRMSHSH